MGQHQGLGEQLVLGGAQGVVADHQAGGEIDNQGQGRALAFHQARQGRRQQVEARWRRAFHRGQAQFAQQVVGLGWLVARGQQHPQPAEGIPAQDLGITCRQQFVAQIEIEGLGGITPGATSLACRSRTLPDSTNWLFSGRKRSRSRSQSGFSKEAVLGMEVKLVVGSRTRH